MSTKVKALVGVYGVYDLKEMWHRYGMQSPRENNIENFLGASPMENPRLYFDASPINYATVANNQIGVFLSVGTEDDLVNRATQTDAFLLALKQAGFFVRTCIVQGAPHYWLNDPIEEPGSYPRLPRAAPRAVPAGAALRSNSTCVAHLSLCLARRALFRNASSAATSLLVAVEIARDLLVEMRRADIKLVRRPDPRRRNRRSRASRRPSDRPSAA